MSPSVCSVRAEAEFASIQESTSSSASVSAGRGAQHLRGQLAVDRVEVVAQGGAGAGAPAVVAREGHDLVAEPVQAETAAEAEVHRGDPLHVQLRLVRHGHDVERREHDRQGRHARGEVLANALLAQLVRTAGERLGVLGREQARDRRVERHRARAEVPDRRRDVELPRPVAEQPAGGALHQPAALEQKRQLNGACAAVVEQLDLAPERPHLEDLARARVGARDLRRRRAGLLVQAERERGAAAVEHVVHHLGRHDLASEPVRAHLLAEALRQRRREVALELG